MTAEYTFELDTEELQRRLTGRGREAFAPLLLFNLQAALDAIGEAQRNAMVRMHRAPPSRGQKKPDDAPLSRITGALMDSIDHEVSPRPGSGSPSDLSRLQMVVFARDISDRRAAGRKPGYARIHEYGGVIRPVNAKWLAIPTPAIFTQGGDVRFSSPRQVEDGRWVPVGPDRANPKLLLFIGNQGLSGGEDEVLFIGLKEVRIPPRLKFVDTFERARPRQERLLFRAVEAALSGRRGFA